MKKRQIFLGICRELNLDFVLFSSLRESVQTDSWQSPWIASCEFCKSLATPLRLPRSLTLARNDSVFVILRLWKRRNISVFCYAWSMFFRDTSLRSIWQENDFSSLRADLQNPRGNLVFLLNAHFLCHCEILWPEKSCKIVAISLNC